jgi:uncharacterized protein
MTRRAGSADLPLHGGHVPKWLADRMTRLGAVMSQAIVHHYGRDELLRRLSHPFWFQSFGAVMGMDWHSQVSPPAHDWTSKHAGSSGTLQVQRSQS